MHILIVDDEHYIVNYLSALISEQGGSELEIYKSYSGPEALEILSQIKIDLMLLDINMPGMSGLEAAKRALENWPACRIIFFTAYDDFEYIYQTKQFNNAAYLLKTEKDEVILKTVFAALETIAQEQKDLHVLSQTQKRNRFLTHLLQQNILKQIVSGHDINKMKHDLHITGSDFVLDLNRPVYLMYMQVNYRTLKAQQTNISEHILQYLSLMKEFLLGRFHYSMLEINPGIFLWFFQPDHNSTHTAATLFTYLKTMSDDFSNYCSSILHRYVTLVLLPVPSDWMDIYTLYHKMQQSAETIHGHGSCLYSTVTIMENNLPISSSYIPAESPDTERQLKELSLCLFQGLGKEYFELLQNLRIACTSVRSMHSILGIRIYTTIALMLLNYMELYQLQKSLSEKTAIYPLYCVHDFPNWNNAFDYLKQFSQSLFQILNSKKMCRHEQIISRIKTYIQGHLSESLTLSKLSGIVNYNDAYISRLFKQVTGIRLSEYITQERIQKSKELLSEKSETIQNIAAMVGFDTAQYFSVVFKKSTGMSANEYRHTIR